jgi:hypothetical protein
MIKDTSRVLAIDPTSKGYAFAVLEGPERLLDFGTAELSAKDESAYLERIDSLFDRYLPHGLIVENPHGPGSRRVPRIANLIREIELIAWRREVDCRRVSRGEVKVVFGESGTTKQEIAVAISRWFPELEGRLPDPRKPWKPEAERMSVFDAVSFALTAFRTLPSEEE